MSNTFPWERLPPELQIQILGYLAPNEVPGTARLVSKAAAEAYSQQEHKIVRLSQPVPRHAFERQWGPGSGVWRTLNYEQRIQVVSLTAASGDVDNLETAFSGSGFVLIPDVVMGAAARAGHLHVCQWIWERRQHQQASIDNTRALKRACREALRGGHADLVGGLRQLLPSGECGLGLKDAVCAAAEGCDLAKLQQLHHDWMQDEGRREEPTVMFSITGECIESAAGSSVPNWRSKVEWLEATVDIADRRQTRCIFCAAARHPDAVNRLEWLQQRGYRMGLLELAAAVEAGNLPAVQYLLGLPGVRAALTAGGHLPAPTLPHLAALQALCDNGYRLTRVDLQAAAKGGQREVVEWVLERPGLAAELQNPSVMFQAAHSGSLELLVWLRERGATWDSGLVTVAAQACSEAALEWMVGQGCPLPGAHSMKSVYLVLARNGDLAIMQALRRLGCPWSGNAMPMQFELERIPPAIKRWLKEEGCPFARLAGAATGSGQRSD